MNVYWIGVAVMTGIMLIAVLSITVLTGFTGLYSFGHAGFMAIGAYTSALTVKYFHIPLFLGILLGVLASVIVGIVMGYPTLKLKGDYFLIATLGFGEIVRQVLENAEGLTNGARGMPDVAGGINLPIVIIVDVIVVILVGNFLRSKYGRNCIAIREEETAAQAMGIDIARTKIISLGFSCALAGLSGALMGHFVQYLQPVMFSMIMSYQLIITVIMGGLGSVTGSILANLILVPLPEVLRIQSVQEIRMLAYGLIVILIILFKPSGLFGYREFTLKDLKKVSSRVKRLSKGRVEDVGKQ